MPISYSRVAKSLDRVMTCLVGNQLLREFLCRPLYLRVSSTTLRTLVLGHIHLYPSNSIATSSRAYSLSKLKFSGTEMLRYSQMALGENSYTWPLT